MTLLLLAFACGIPWFPASTTPPLAPTPSIVSQPPILDEVAWLEQLRRARPDLMARSAGPVVADPGWLALVLRPRYRDELLGSDATYALIVAREYPGSDRLADAVWAERMRATQLAFRPTPTVRPARYPLEIYTGYQVRGGQAVDGNGYTWKVFFELADFQDALSPELYLDFVHGLAEAGFRGDSKIDLRPGSARFQYNNVIVHAPSIAMALCAEQVGLERFSDDLEHVARGVDVRDWNQALSWHKILLTGQYDTLPPEVRDFVDYRSPVAADPCSR